VRYTQKALENDVWSMDDFDVYMSDNDYKYIVEGTNMYAKEIQFLSSDMHIIKYPNGIMGINELFTLDGTNAEVLILSPSIEKVSYPIGSKAKNLKRLVIQEGATILDLSGVTDLPVLTRIEFPQTLMSLRGGLNRLDSIAQLDFSNTKLNSIMELANILPKLTDVSFPYTITKIYNSFSDLRAIKALDLSGTQIDTIRNCFNDLPNLEYLKLPKTLKNVSMSFNNLPSLTKIEFDEASNLSSIFESFQRTGIEKVDLSKCSLLGYVGDLSFTESKNLKEVILPDELLEVGNGAFSLCNGLKKVHLPRNLQELHSHAFKFSAINDVTLPKSIQKIGSFAFGGIKKIAIEEGVTEINNGLFDAQFDFDTLIIPNSVKKIGKSSFSYFGAKNIVFRSDESKLLEIEDEAFKASSITSLILPEGVTTIGSRSFELAVELEYILLPRSLKIISDDAFERTGTAVKGGTIYFVYSGSIGFDYAVTHNLRFVIIESPDDALKIIKEDRSISDAENAKFKMIKPEGKIFESFLDPTFYKYSSRLYKMYNYLTKPRTYPSNHRLDTKKFINIPIDDNKYSFLSTINNIKKKSYLIQVDPNDIKDYTENNLSPVFVTLCNYLTAIMKPIDPELLGEVYLYNSLFIVYADNVSSIITFVVGSIIAVVVIINNVIKFFGFVDMPRRYNKFIDAITTKGVYMIETKGALEDILRPGDFIKLGYKSNIDITFSTLNNTPLPLSVLNIAQEYIKKYFVWLKLYKYKNSLMSIFLALLTGKVITARVEVDKNSESASDLTSLMVVSIEDFDKLSDKTTKLILEDVKHNSNIKDTLESYRFKGYQ